MPIPQLKEKPYLNNEKKNRKSMRRKLISSLFLLGVILVLVGIVFTIGLFAWVSKDLPDPNKINDRAVAQSTKIYDRTGKTVLYEIFGEQKRTLVKIEDLPNYVKWATIALEDQKFYAHHGIDFKGILRAVYTNIIRRKASQGASTITQQLVKNSILTSEKSIWRKAKEIILSYQLEKKFTKDQILQMYLNEIPYGSVAYGIQSASQTFFAKDAKDLTLAEAATLASLPQSPTRYSPYGSHVDILMGRKDYCLDQMAELGYITKEEAETAKKQELVFKKQKEGIIAPHFVMYVKELLTEKYGEKEVEKGGMKVYTTLDMDKQRFAEEAVTENAEAMAKNFNANNAALTALDPKTGQILAMVGSKDYFNEEIDGNVNVTIRLRQPGSSIKPIVYASLFEKGYTPDTILFDVVTSFKTGAKDYIPKNFNFKEYGPVTIRKALAGSLNIPAVKALYLAGLDNVLTKTEELDYANLTLANKDNFGLSLVLGGAEVRLLDHTAAYGAFSQNGVMHKTNAILKVEDSNGKILEEFEDKSKKVWNENTARQISSILSDNNARSYIFGTSNPLTLGSRPVAAKTGTTNDYKDSWTMGYTPSLVAGVWAGNNDSSEMVKGASSAQVAAPIWHSFMAKALEGTPIEYFTDYTRIGENKKPVLGGNAGNEVTVKIDRASGKLATEFTPQSFIEEKTYKEFHCILYYVNKDDPWGQVPTNPNIDPQYGNWEKAVQDWVNKQIADKNPDFVDLNLGKAPTEYDDLHVPANTPSLSILAPAQNQTISSVTLNVETTASSLRGVRKVNYYVDDNLLLSKTENNIFSAALTLDSRFQNGFHTLKAEACDDIDNCKSETLDFNLLAQRDVPIVTWLGPNSDSKFYFSSFPLKLNVFANDPYGIDKIHFYYYSLTDNSSQLITTVNEPKENSIFVSWSNAPGAGRYQIYGEMIGKNGQSAETGRIEITIE